MRVRVCSRAWHTFFPSKLCKRHIVRIRSAFSMIPHDWPNQDFHRFIASTIDGWFINPRAMAARCICPPDIEFARLYA